MSSFDDINVTRDALMTSLGERSTQYMQLMKLWFHMKSTKQEFDVEARKLLAPHQLQLHNKFLLQLFIKCSKQDVSSLSPPVISHRSKRRKTQEQIAGFKAANFYDYLLFRTPKDESPSYCTDHLVLPDCEFIHMRFMLAAWELGLKGAEQSAAEILVVAVQQFLKNIITATLSRRSGFKVIEKRIQLAIGMPVPNPWLKNTADLLSSRPTGPVLGLLETGDIGPLGCLSVSDMQQDIALAYAAGPDCVDKPPVTAAECFEALQIHKSAVMSHEIYSINMERIAARMHHPSWEDFGE